MVKTNQITKFVNGEIIDADPVNQALENVGSEGGSIPYNENDQERVTDGSESLGSAAYPWGTINVSRDAYLNEVETVSHTVASSVLFSELRKFINQKDTPSSYSGEGGKTVVVKDDESGLEFESGVNDLVAGDVLLASADTERNVSVLGYTKCKEIEIPYGVRGEVRVKFDLKRGAGGAVYGKIYINGVATGTERSDSTGSYQTFSEDFSGLTAGDKIQLYCKYVTNGGFTRNFRIYDTLYETWTTLTDTDV